MVVDGARLQQLAEVDGVQVSPWRTQQNNGVFIFYIFIFFIKIFLMCLKMLIIFRCIASV